MILKDYNAHVVETVPHGYAIALYAALQDPA
jgi:hypothetical protein